MKKISTILFILILSFVILISFKFLIGKNLNKKTFVKNYTELSYEEISFKYKESEVETYSIKTVYNVDENSKEFDYAKGDFERIKTAASKIKGYNFDYKIKKGQLILTANVNFNKVSHEDFNKVAGSFENYNTFRNINSVTKLLLENDYKEK